MKGKIHILAMAVRRKKERKERRKGGRKGSYSVVSDSLGPRGL